MPTKLSQLKTMTTVVADTGDIDAMKQYNPVDATTNPSLLYKAAQQSQYRELLIQAIRWGQENCGSSRDQLSYCLDKFAVRIGREMLKLIPGRVSTEVDALLSFDTQATIERAHRIIALYREEGIGSDRVLIKIAATWEGIRAAKILEQEGIQCNLTLLFGFAQAVECANANVTLISPFVGRILDWYKARTPQQKLNGQSDQGVISVRKIYQYYKQHKFKTIVMGASFRNTDQIEALAGCDRLTISPQLMAELEEDTGDLSQKLHADDVFEPMEKVLQTESQFRLSLNRDAMATEKLAEGIRGFIRDQIKLEELINHIAKDVTSDIK